MTTTHDADNAAAAADGGGDDVKENYNSRGVEVPSQKPDVQHEWMAD